MAFLIGANESGGLLKSSNGKKKKGGKGIGKVNPKFTEETRQVVLGTTQK